MGGGASVPYALRQNKFVDRRIFIDLLSRVERFSPLDDHVYISMGGATLEDHRLAHAHLGLNRLLSFDNAQWVIDRQQFNKPVDYVRLVKLSSSDLIANFSAHLNAEGFGASPNVAMWLDYTEPKNLGKQLGEFNQLLDVLQPMDVVRITVNASASGIYSPRMVDGALETEDKFKPIRLEKLAARLGDYFPTDTKAEDMSDERLPYVVAAALQKATNTAFPATSKLLGLPLSVLRYSDGQQMMSATIIVLNRDERDDFLKVTRAERWPFFSATWQSVHQISVPDLSLRERMFINERIPTKTPAEICNDMGFEFDDDIEASKAYIEQYSKYYRFYPHFHYVSV